MTVASRFQPRPEGALSLTLDGALLHAHAGDSLAAAILCHSGEASRTTGRDNPRTGFCMMGVCFDCLVEVDGLPNVQACMTQARDGMTVRRQIGLRKLGTADV
jgi:D-hydroxyproline dehydrogenase subunit gamma